MEKENKIKLWFKKINWKLISWILSIIGFITIIGIVIGIKVNKPYKPSFYNYASYISQTNRKKLEKDFDYKEFQTIQEFTNALDRNQAIGGISTDNQAVTLIKKDKLKKIDYEKILGKGITSPEKFLTPVAWNFLTSYDDYLKTDINGNPFKDGPRHLWEYFVPYYIQSCVIAYNHSKNNNKYINVEPEDSYFEILQKLHKKGYKNLQVLDDVRNNLAIGSTRFKTKAINGKNEYINKFNEFNGNATINNYEQQIDSFFNLISDSLEWKIGEKSNKVIFNGDGQIVLESLINLKSDCDMALLFNGDALDAYYSGDNFEELADQEGSITIVKPKNGILTMDGIVINKAIDKSSNSDKSIENIINAFCKTYKDVTVFDEITKEYDKDKSIKELEKMTNYKVDEINENGKIIKEISINYEATEFLSNFDLINYTPVYKVEYDFIKKHYFKYWDEDSNMIVNDNDASEIYSVDGAGYINIKPIPLSLMSKINVKYNLKIKS
ncbi:hypothetical protein [Mycoplasma sp. Mirounga ES2805-ORL]|uniref:hypothetical protein n=1 Tax=Mycoplasma sp. Mirounga ES2805-ORL TaxID=754514 RepID=UPI00197BF9AE|nr:hypothetical protein [Mycoplasma sp. Mirounga ES2805-ORL]QSF13976.1 hypothetical protein JXZ90_01660 [Mycoplasma sp. Mirounga ES2805-ORL]